jgi:hypothetical protein
MFRPLSAISILVLGACGQNLTVAGFNDGPAPSGSPCAPSSAPPPQILFDGVELVALCSGLYVEPSISEADRQRVRVALANAVQRTEYVYGPLTATDWAVVFCKSDACRTYFAGTSLRSFNLAPGGSLEGARYVAARDTMFIQRIDDEAQNVLTHELHHVELRHRLGGVIVPTWFDEGAATLIANEPNCAFQTEKGIDDLRQLDEGAQWWDFTNTQDVLVPTYCQARAEVRAWVKTRGPAEYLALIQSLKENPGPYSFYERYGPMLTQAPPRTVENKNVPTTEQALDVMSKPGAFVGGFGGGRTVLNSFVWSWSFIDTGAACPATMNGLCGCLGELTFQSGAVVYDAACCSRGETDVTATFLACETACNDSGDHVECQ